MSLLDVTRRKPRPAPPGPPRTRRSAPNPPVTWADNTVVLPGGGSVLDGRPVITPWSER